MQPTITSQSFDWRAPVSPAAASTGVRLQKDSPEQAYTGAVGEFNNQTQDAPMTRDDLPAFSRGTDIFGCLDDIMNVRMNGDMKLEVLKKARAHGFHDASDYVRLVLAVELYGLDHVVRVTTERILGIATSVTRSGDGK